MHIPSLVQGAARLGHRVAGVLSFLPPLATRLVVGQAFFLTGRGKLGNLAGVTEFFTGLGIPFPELNAAFVSRLEYYGGILLILGLLTRPVAALLASTMVVALLTADKASFLEALAGTGDAGLTDVAPFILLLFLSWLVLYGPGLLSADRVLFSRLGQARTDAPHAAPLTPQSVTKG